MTTCIEEIEIEIEAPIEEIEIGMPGPPGKPGPPGPAGGSSVERTAAESLSALTIVWEDADGKVSALDNKDAAHIDMLCGLTITATPSAGEAVLVQLSGAVDISGLGLVPGRVWLGPNGTLTQTPPEDGFDVLIGRAVGQQLYLSITDHINLEH